MMHKTKERIEAKRREKREDELAARWFLGATREEVPAIRCIRIGKLCLGIAAPREGARTSLAAKPVKIGGKTAGFALGRLPARLQKNERHGNI